MVVLVVNPLVVLVVHLQFLTPMAQPGAVLVVLVERLIHWLVQAVVVLVATLVQVDKVDKVVEQYQMCQLE
jgi:hypothetical protein